MKNLNHLPENFAFKLDELGKRWIRETFGTDAYNCDDNYFHFPDYANFKGFKIGNHSCDIVKKDYTLITTDQLFPQPQIPTIEKGVMMLVWHYIEEDAVKREVMFFDGQYYYARNKNSSSSLAFYKNAKPIPQLPEYTIEEAELKFNIKIKK